MATSDSFGRLRNTSGRGYGNGVLWVCGGSAAMVASTRAMTWGLATLRTWYFATLSTMFLSTMMMAQTSGATPKSNAEIDKAVDTYRRAVLAGDAQAIAATYADDGVELPPGQPLVRGRAAIERRYRDFCSGPLKVTGFTFAPIESAIAGDSAYDVGTYEQHVSRPSGETMTDRGKYLVILKRSHGGWKAAYAMYNSDTPAMSSAAAPDR